MIDTNTFDESKIDWKPLPGPDGEPTEHISLSFLNVDEEAKIVDILFKFSGSKYLDYNNDDYYDHNISECPDLKDSIYLTNINNLDNN